MTNRRTFLKVSAAGIVTTLATRPKLAFAAKTTQLKWRLALGVPKTLPIWGSGINRLANTIAKLSNNHLLIQVYGAGELVPALATFDAVKSGALQMGHSASYYWQGKIPASAYFCAIPFGMQANCINAWMASTGSALWQELMEPYGVLSFACGNSGQQCLGWYRKPINTAQDLKGLKIRIPGLAGKVFAKAGATPVLLPGSEVFTSLATGVIDAAEWVGPYHDSLMGFSKAVDYYYGSGWHEPSSMLELMINKKAWDDLSDELKDIVKLAISETHAEMLSQWEMQNVLFFDKLKKETSVKLLSLNPDILIIFKKYADEVLGDIAESSALAQKIHNSYFEFKAQFEAFQKWAKIPEV